MSELKQEWQIEKYSTFVENWINLNSINLNVCF